jgi:NO-binding membrane sensor protein with MHYT domain
VASRLVRWFTFTVLFALLPLGVTILLRKLTGTFTIRALEDSPEILFFALMICATSLGDMQALRTAVGKDLPLLVLWSALLLGSVFSAILYGSLAYDKLVTGGTEAFQQNLLSVSVLVAVIFFVLALIVQILLSRIEKAE